MNSKEKNSTKNKKEHDSIRSKMDDRITSDVLGSYTGVAMGEVGEDPYEKPIQDADDL